MSISYLEAVKLKVTESIFARGVKYYLNHKVRGKSDMLLPFWRIYNVKGETHTYQVEFPIAHRLKNLTSNKELVGILEQHARCDCPYFTDYGLCKHIVAICSELDQEFFEVSKDFKLKNDAKHIAKLQEHSVLDQVFGVEQDKKLAQYFSFLFKDNAPSYLTKEMIKEIEREWSQLLPEVLEIQPEQDWLDFMSKKANAWILEAEADLPISKKILTEFSPKLGFYKEEKDILLLVEKSVYFWHSPACLVLILAVIQKISPAIQSRLIYLLFRLSFSVLAEAPWVLVWKKYLSLKSLNKEVVELIYSYFLEDFGEEAAITTAFALWTRDEDWLAERLSLLTNQELLEVNEILPDKHEEIDYILQQRVILWLDYLPADVVAYQELSYFLRSWSEKLGQSENFFEVLARLRQVHSKKKSLLQLIKDL